MHTAIVTGGTKGIGFGIAKALLEAGGKVMITGRDASGVDDAVSRLSAHAGPGARVLGHAVDVRHRAAVDALVADTVIKEAFFEPSFQQKTWRRK